MGLLTINDFRMFGMGQDNSDCGAKPGTGPGEKAMCCPDIGWVVYDATESEYALCERASAQAGGAVADEDEYEAPPLSDPTSPMASVEAAAARLEAQRQELEARREALEEQRHQEAIEMLQLQAKIAQEEARRRAQEAKRQAEASQKLAELKAKQKAERQKEFYKALPWIAGAGVLFLFLKR